jgi:acyl-CoA thioester hydrolase
MQVFKSTYRVPYTDCTVGNHVYHSRYLDILEVARNEFFRSLGSTFLSWQEQGVVFPVVECQLKYRAPARYDDVLAIELWMTRVGPVRMNFCYRVVNQKGTLILEAETFHVATGLDEKPRRLAEDLVARLTPFLKEPE